MKQTMIFFFLFIVISGCKSVKKRNVEISNSDEMTLSNSLQQIVDSMYLKHPNTKGISIHVLSPDLGMDWSYATGWADSTTQRKLNKNDPALIASITKTYVSAAILKLVENDSIQLNQPISTILTNERLQQLRNSGYDPDAITIAHLNAQTSGIYDFVNTSVYQKRTLEEPNHIWSMDEQTTLALSKEKAFNPGDKFEYSETNNLLLAEILELKTGLPYHEALRSLLRYKKNKINNTWVNWLEPAPENSPPLVHQFATEYNVDSYTLHPSFDVFGGGGIAATPRDVALFTQLFFTGQLFDTAENKHLIFETTPIASNTAPSNYYMGIAKTELGQFTAFGHGGFWGTTTQYIPELNTSVTIFFMERDEWPHYFEMLEQIAQALNEV